MTAHARNSYVFEQPGKLRALRQVSLFVAHQSMEQLQESAVDRMVHLRANGVVRTLEVLEDDRAPGSNHVHHPSQGVLGLFPRPL